MYKSKNKFKEDPTAKRRAWNKSNMFIFYVFAYWKMYKIHRLGLFLCAGTLLGKQHCLDVGQDTTLSDGDSSKKLVQLLVISDSQLQMPGDDARLLIVPGSVTSQLQDLGCKVLHDSCHVDRGTSADTLGVIPFSEQSVNPPM